LQYFLASKISALNLSGIARVPRTREVAKPNLATPPTKFAYEIS